MSATASARSGWTDLVTTARRAGVDTSLAQARSVARARALAAGAGLYRDQRERGTTADRDALLAAGAAAAHQILVDAAIPGDPAPAPIDPAVIGELGDRSLDGLGVLVRRSVGALVVESMLAEGALPSPIGTSAIEAATPARPECDLQLVLGHDATVSARVVIAATTEPVIRHLAAHDDVPLVYASSDAIRDLPDSVVRVGPDDAPFAVGGPTVVDIGLRSDDVARAVAPSFEVGAEVVDAIPVVALGLIAARATRRLLTTTDEAATVGRDALDAASDVMVNRGVGQLAAIVTGAKVVVAPVAVTTGLARKVARRSTSSVERSRAVVAGMRSEIARIGAWYDA